MTFTPDFLNVRYSSLLVYHRKYGLVRIHCPFKVIVLKPYSDLTLGSSHMVDYLRFRPSLPHYRIGQKFYPHTIFLIDA